MPIIDLKTIEKKELLSGYKVRFVHSDNVTFAFWDVKAGSSLPTHSHIHEQISQVTEGEFELTIRTTLFYLNKEKLLSFPQMLNIQARQLQIVKLLTHFTL